MEPTPGAAALVSRCWMSNIAFDGGNDGQKREIARRGEFEFDPAGKPVRFVGVVQDVTDGRKTGET
ncbi:hypothetical protein [Rhizobium sp. AC44/96]|uniref:hypothetical protein n=1 Tax=Rhizobium sp. AC44/96 TaxID=1841654 RepID=UPI00114723E6|nr:hypothetical protein [Rhizobium sp. AC44/96]